MTSTLPPTVSYFNGLNYNSSFYFNPSDNLTQQQADQLYFKYPISQSGTETVSGKLNVIGSTTLSQLSVTDGTNSVTITPTSNPATTVKTTTDNSSATTGYLTFTEANSGNGLSLYTADTTKILSYAPSTGTLSTTQIACGVMNQPSTSSTCNLWNGLTTGSVNIASTAQTTGSITIGSTTTTTGTCNIRPPLVLARQLQTTTNASYLPNSSTHLGYQVSTLGASFTTTSLTASTNTNLYSVSFTSANYGTYLFIANAIITPTDTTVDRQVEISISTATATIQAPHFAMMFIPKSGGSAPQLTLSRVIQIYADTTVYLVGYCQGTASNVQTTSNNGLFSYTRIA